MDFNLQLRSTIIGLKLFMVISWSPKKSINLTDNNLKVTRADMVITLSAF